LPDFVFAVAVKQEDKMSMKARFVFVTLIMTVLLLTGCAGAFGGSEVTPVDSQTVTAPLQYLDRVQRGPLYNVSVDVPAEWVGEFEMLNTGNVLQFRYVGEAKKAGPLFYIEALSAKQYWKASGSYPASQVNIVNRGDTYFVYHLPIDAFYSGLSPDAFEALAAAVPQVVASFTAESAE
jgi:hypothetical protein